MSRVSISRSYAVLVGLESYTQTRKKVKTAEKLVVREKDKLLHPEKLELEAEANRDKSESAEKERRWLEEQQRKALELKQQEQKQSTGSISGKFSRALLKLKRRKNSAEIDTGNPECQQPGTRSRIPGTGPEDGIPAPEGQR